MGLIFIVKVLQITVSVLIVILVLIQGQGGGLSSSVGNSISMYRSRRGVERIVLIMTIFLSLVLVVNSLVLINII